jgi:hypothetical protein
MGGGGVRHTINSQRIKMSPESKKMQRFLQLHVRDCVTLYHTIPLLNWGGNWGDKSGKEGQTRIQSP